MPGLAVAALGVPVGLLWSLLAPRPDLVRTAEGVDYANSETKDFIAADAILFLLCLAAGLLVGLVVWRWASAGGLRTLLALVGGSGVGAVVAWQVGLTDPSRAAVLAAARAGRLAARYDLPLELHAHSVLLAWPGAAALVWAVQLVRTPAVDPEVPPVSSG
ncbi:MAG TPA: hypothetical protein VFR07_09195 [Mycobacteriales bacterium]|nr:hypothetical protein [Mycobacteriales bacterium]